MADGQAQINMDYVFNIFQKLRDELPILVAPTLKDHADVALYNLVESLQLQLSAERSRADRLQAVVDAAMAAPEDDEIEAIASCLEDVAAIYRDDYGYEMLPNNMEKAASMLRMLAAQQPAGGAE